MIEKMKELVKNIIATLKEMYDNFDFDSFKETFKDGINNIIEFIKSKTNKK